MMNMKKGFTMTEVLVVTVILAVMATLIVPRFFGQSERGAVAEAVAHLSALRQAEASYKLENPTLAYATDLTSETGPLDLEVTSTKFTYTVDATTGAVTATRHNDGTIFDHKTIILNMDGTWAAGTHPYTPTNPS